MFCCSKNDDNFKIPQLWIVVLMLIKILTSIRNHKIKQHLTNIYCHFWQKKKAKINKSNNIEQWLYRFFKF